MGEHILEEDFFNRLKIIKKIPVKIPNWLATILLDINSHHTKFRSLLQENSENWTYLQYCENLSLHHYKLALLYYNIFDQYKINLKCALNAVENCLVNLRTIMDVAKIPELNKTTFDAAKKLHESIVDIYQNIESRRNDNCRLQQASVNIEIGNIDHYDYDLSSPEFETFYPKYIAIEIINLISKIEAIFSSDTIINPERKYRLSCCLAEAYQLCNQSEISEYYLNEAKTHITTILKELESPDNTFEEERQVKMFIKNSVKNQMSCTDVKTVLTQKYDYPSSVELMFIETKYIKYCINNYLTEIDVVLIRIIEAQSEEYFKKLLVLLDSVKHLKDIPDFFHGNYYQLLIENYKLIKQSQEQQLIKQFKQKCWEAIVPYLETAEKETDLLKQLIQYLRSSLNCRLAISTLELQKFCNKTLSSSELIQNILNLRDENNPDLIELQSTANILKEQKSLFLLEKFIDVLYTYAFPVEPEIKKVNGRNVIELNGKLIIISEIYTELLRLKTKDIEEIHFVGADIVHIDTDLKKEDWTGINILIVAKCIVVDGEVTWNVGGFDGSEHNSSASNGENHGEDGCNGSDGEAGKSGGNIHISCLDIINSNNWTLLSCGGNGANGQTGGNGMPGQNGTGISSVDFKKFITTSALQLRDDLFDLAKHDLKRKWDKCDCDQYRHTSFSCRRSSVYLQGVCTDGKEITYSYYCGSLWMCQSYLLIEGTMGESGGRGGKGGYGGASGFEGQICINCAKPMVVNVMNKPGIEGKSGNDGKCGESGRNGWDMGHIYDNRFASSLNKTIGSNQDSKLCLVRSKTQDSDEMVYCQYQEEYVKITSKSNKQMVYDRSTNKQRDNKKEQHSIAVRINSISTEVISKHEEYLTTDTNNLQNQFDVIKQQAIQGNINKDERNETTELKMKHQIILNNSNCLYTGKKIVNATKYLKTNHTNQYVQDILSNLSNYTSWIELKDKNLTYDELNELFSILDQNRLFPSEKYSEIYNLLLNKYKYVKCHKMLQTNLTTISDNNFELRPIGNYLKKSTNIQEYVQEDLGTLNEFFKTTDKSRLENLVNYSKTLKLGSILYPLKFFLTEKRYENPKFQTESQIFMELLNNFESKLEHLIKCYQFCSDQNKNSAILNEITNKKLKLQEDFDNNSANFESIITEFYTHIIDRGISSTSVRELLAYIYDCNIKIFIQNEFMKLDLYHDHNPIAKNCLYLLLQNGYCTELVLDQNYKNLMTTRNHQSKLYGNILQNFNNFVCKHQFDEFEPFPSVQNYFSCVFCFKLTENQLISAILEYYPIFLRPTIQLKINKFTQKYIGNNHILCTLVKRFKIEGVQITVEELSYFVNSVLKASVNNEIVAYFYEWIITAYPQDKWLNELFYLELQNSFRDQLTNLKTLIHRIEQKHILLLMEAKLYDLNDTVDLKCIELCLNYLTEIEVKVESVKNLPLSKWPYLFRELYLEYKLLMITKWNEDEIQRALYYLTCLESHQVGSEVINHFLEIMLKLEVSAEIMIKFLVLLHNQEWTLNDEFLQKISNCDINNILLNKSEQKNEERSLEILLNLIKTNQYTSKEIIEVLNKFPGLSCLLQSDFKTSSTTEITDWAKKFKDKISSVSANEKNEFIQKNTNEILIMIFIGIKLKRSFVLRKTQRIAILLLLFHNHNTLAQISTGEGKSLIAVAAAIFKALCNEKVDIITSSSVLAVRDAKINEDIYKLFDITVSHNCHDSLNDRKEAYSSSQVIYGDLSNFQRDFLLDRFYGKNVLGSQNFENVIVDEVDSMLLDKGNNTLYLSHEIPGLDKLESVYLFLWKRIILSSDINEDTDWVEMLTDAVLYDLYGTLSPNDLKTTLNIKDLEANEIFEFLFKEEVVNRKKMCLKPFSQVDQTKIPEKYQKYKDDLVYITTNILNRAKEIEIPKCFYTFVENHLSLWIRNAVIASTMEEGQDYVVDVDRTSSRPDINPNITIIDKGTGTDQSNSQWEEALHQFLQLKHGCKVSAQSLKAVFISNVSYFKKYTNLFGLTGTLGSQVERDLLEELYEVHFVNIPTAKPKTLIELEPILCLTQYEWLFRIVHRTKALILENRSVLIICETIKEVNQVHKACQRAQMANIIIYKREYEECSLAQGKDELEPGRVIIATNLAGRGTDIKINDTLNEAGGLHVLLTYLPNNSRIEQQAFGRAARSGYNGSAQLLIRGKGNLFSMRSERDTFELQRISEIKQFYDTRITVEEEYFDKFSELYRELKSNSSESTPRKIHLQRCLDRWAIWLDENSKHLNKPSSIIEFNSFLNQLKNNFENWKTWTEDPVSLTKFGINQILAKQHDAAIEIFDFVCREEPDFCEAAHYYKAAAIAMKLDFEKRPFQGQMYDEYLQLLEELSKADKLFERRKFECIKAATFVQNLKESMKNTFVQIDAYNKQQENYISIFDFYQKSIKNIFGHSVHKLIFKNPEINASMSEEIFDGLLNNGYLKKSFITEITKDNLLDISEKYGIFVDELYEFLQNKSGDEINEDEFLEELKKTIEIPSVEEFWEILIQDQKLVEETTFVIVDKSKLTAEEDNQVKMIETFQIDTKLNDKNRVFLKKVSDLNLKNYYLISKDTFISTFGIQKYDTFKKQSILTVNKIASVSKQKCSEPINKFDSVQSVDLILDHVSKEKSEEILNQLIVEKFLKKDSTNLYRLSGKYDEKILNKINLYSSSVKNVFQIKFSYRIALQTMLKSLENDSNSVFIKLPTEPHISLMWDLIDNGLIQPAKVLKFDNDDKIINNIISKYSFNRETKKFIINHIKNILHSSASVLDRLEVPKFVLASIDNYLAEMQVSPLQEFSTCKLNALALILTAEEKRYTLKMIASTLTIMLLGICQIVLGLVIQLFSVGLMTHVGGFLIGEGVSDLIYTATCWKSGYFSWESYKNHKIESVIISIATAGVGALLSKGIQYSRFGSKIALKGVSTVGIEVAEMTGKELIKTASWEVCEEIGKRIVEKSCEGIIKGFAGVAVDHIIESYLQNLCSTIADTILSDINNAVSDHKINYTLEQAYRNLGADRAQELITYYTTKNFSETLIKSKYLSSFQSIFDVISSGFGEALQKGAELKGDKLIRIVSKILTYSKYITHIIEIREIVLKLLDNLNNQICIDLEQKNHTFVIEFNENHFNKFRQNVIFHWQEILCENAQQMISKNLLKPLLDQTLHILLTKAYEGLKKLYKYAHNTFLHYKFMNRKEQYETQMQDELLSTEAKERIENIYQESLMLIRYDTKSADMYADLVSENGYMDSVCLKSYVDISPEPIQIIVDNLDSGITEVFQSDCLTDDKPKIIRLKLQDGHYTNVNHPTRISSSKKYDCAFDALAADLPELLELGPDNFRKNICDNIRTNPEIIGMISQGYHRFTLRKRSYGGFIRSYVEIKINTKALHDNLMAGNYTFSQSSAGEFTQDGIHLSDLAKNIESSGFIGNPVEAVSVADGRLIFIDHRRVISASTLNNPDISIVVRVFPHGQDSNYSPAMNKVQKRIRSSRSWNDLYGFKYPESGYRLDQLRIRPDTRENSVFNDRKRDFFRKTNEMGYIQYDRSPEDIIRDFISCYLN